MVDRIRRAGAVSWAVCGIAALVVLLGVIGYVLRVIWPPLILAGAIVFLLNPVVTRLQARHIPRVLGTAVSYLAVVAITVRQSATASARLEWIVAWSIRSAAPAASA